MLNFELISRWLFPPLSKENNQAPLTNMDPNFLLIHELSRLLPNSNLKDYAPIPELAFLHFLSLPLSIANVNFFQNNLPISSPNCLQERAHQLQDRGYVHHFHQAQPLLVQPLCPRTWSFLASILTLPTEKLSAVKIFCWTQAPLHSQFYP